MQCCNPIQLPSSCEPCRISTQKCDSNAQLTCRFCDLSVWEEMASELVRQGPKHIRMKPKISYFRTKAFQNPYLRIKCPPKCPNKRRWLPTFSPYSLQPRMALHVTYGSHSDIPLLSLCGHCVTQGSLVFPAGTVGYRGAWAWQSLTFDDFLPSIVRTRNSATTISRCASISRW
jgi:hypothetical protein